MDRRRRRAAGGFTLIELLLVVVIIGLLAAIVVPSLVNRVDDAKIDTARASVTQYSACLNTYKLDTGTYPSTDEGLAALLIAPSSLKDPKKWKGPYLQETAIPKDPWGNDFVYKFPSERGLAWPDVYSAGPDGTAGNEDDIYREQQ